MCGIAGFIQYNSNQGDYLNPMLEALIHRGPDSMGTYINPPYFGGIRRLKINDVEHGDQPLYNENKDVVVIYNGEIYNSPELRSLLEKKGHQFKTHSDGEVICHLYEECGGEVFEKLEGMYAIALWDDKIKTLFLARDLPGEKPLYYSQLSKNEIVFSSEIKSLTRFPFRELHLNYQAIWDFPTFLWIPEPLSIYKEIYALEPGHYLKINRESIQKFQTRNLFISPVEGLSLKEQIEKIREVVRDVVTSRLLSDVPVGCFLSSGLDSSLVSTIASQHLTELSTFTIGFEDLDDPYHGKADESVYAEQYAKKLGTKHYAVHVKAKDFFNELDFFAKYGDLPIGVSSGLGISFISRLAKEKGVKVLLTGDGADECFGGYSWYSYLSNQQNSNYHYNNDVSFQNTGLSIEHRLNVLNSYHSHQKAWAWHYYASENEKKELFNPELFDKISSSLRHFAQYKNSNSWSPKDYINQDRAFYFPNEMLRKVDRFTMAHSVEGRPPFAAPAIQSLAAQLPYEWMVKENTLKWILREAFKDILPEEIVQRPKHGFNVPIDHWLKNEWASLVDETFDSSSALYRQGLIRKNSLEVARKMLLHPTKLNGHTIFCYIMLNKWFNLNFN